MTKLILSTLLFAIVLINIVNSKFSRIEIVNNGYENIVFSLPSTVEANNRPKIVKALQNLLWHASAVLLDATKGRAFFRSVSFIIPNAWGDIETWLPGHSNTTSLEEAGALDSMETDDIIITNHDVKEYSYTLHHRGCGKQALRIYLSSDDLKGNLHEESKKFIKLWSEYRYGVFPENGFENDEKFPLTFNIPGEKNSRITGCTNEPFRIPQDCEVSWNCDKNFIIPSIMDQHYTNGTSFCEGYTGLGQIHIPEAPTKQNLLCNEEGTYFTVLRNSDFKNGKNAAPRFQRNDEITFRYIKEAISTRVFVVIDISSNMRQENRYTITKNAFSQFVLYDLPDNSNLSLIVFGGEENYTLITSDVRLEEQNSKIVYLENQPLPDDPSEMSNPCAECALEGIIQILKNGSGVAPHIIMVTAQQYIDEFKYQSLVQTLKEWKIHLHILFFPDSHSASEIRRPSLYSLCNKTRNEFISLSGDVFGNLYNGFSSAIKAISKNTLVSQQYLTRLDEENIFHAINVDETMTKSMTISLSGPEFGTIPLKYDHTVLKAPDNSELHPHKQELVPSWVFNLPSPQPGIYVLKTWRKRRATTPVLVSVTGTPIENEDIITVKLWAETQESQFSQSPIEIFGDVRKGTYPIVNATVTAYINHPNGYGVSQMMLLDDGLGSIDLTRYDGIYSGIFTNFTSIGYYTVYLVATGGFDYMTAIQKGPSSFCCGSAFPSNEQIQTLQFTRKSGPVTFKVDSVPERDVYPPAKITDLRVSRSYDAMFVLQWTAVGNNYDKGIASTYEVKLFRDRTLIRNRFFDSGLEIYNATISTTKEATYGTTLFHVLKFIQLPDTGFYYAGIRAVDESGNYGEPSNAVTIWLQLTTSNRHIDCGPPYALELNVAPKLFASDFYKSFILIYIFIYYLPRL